MYSAAHTTRPRRIAPSKEIPTYFGRPLHRLTVDEYHKMIDAGAFPPDAKCELIHGWILDKRAAESATRPPRTSDPSKLIPTAFGQPLLRIAVRDYHKMIDAGAIQPDARCELLFGWIIDIMPPNPPHSTTSYQIVRNLVPLFPEPDYFLGIADAITLSVSEPMPDFFAAVGPKENYKDRHPSPGDVLLVVEISDTTIRSDRGAKLPLYASEGIPQYWILDVKARRIEVYAQPRRGKKPGYRKKTIYSKDEEVPVNIGGKKLGKVAVSQLLP